MWYTLSTDAEIQLKNQRIECASRCGKPSKQELRYHFVGTYMIGFEPWRGIDVQPAFESAGGSIWSTPERRVEALARPFRRSKLFHFFETVKSETVPGIILIEFRRFDKWYIRVCKYKCSLYFSVEYVPSNRSAFKSSILVHSCSTPLGLNCVSRQSFPPRVHCPRRVYEGILPSWLTSQGLDGTLLPKAM